WRAYTGQSALSIARGVGALGEPLPPPVQPAPDLGPPAAGALNRPLLGVQLALWVCSCTRLSCAAAVVTAFSAARCLAAMGATTALLSSCCTCKRSAGG